MTKNQINEIAQTLDIGFRCFIHKASLEVISVPDEDKHPGMEMESWKKELGAIKKAKDKYFEVVGMDSRDSFSVMEEFVQSVEDGQLQEKLEQSLRRPKPFWNFKFEIDNSGPYRDRWFAFKEGKLIEWVDEQLLRNKL